MLIKNGFKETEWENEWNKDSWTIRIYKDEIEVFNEPRINTPGVYYKCKTTMEKLELILKEIDERMK